MANYVAGGRTPLAAVVHGIVLLAIVLGLGKYAESIPLAVLAAILIKVGIDILDYRIIPVLHKLPIADLLIFMVVLIVTIVHDLLAGMMVGIAIAVIRFAIEVSRVYKPKTDLLSNLISSKNKYDKQIEVLELEGPMFFGSIEAMDNAYNNLGDKEVLLINLSNVNMIDLSGAFGLEDLIKKAEKEGKYIVVTGANKNVYKVLKNLNVLKRTERIRYIQDVNKAIDYSREIAKDLVNTKEETKLEKIDSVFSSDIWYVIGD